MDTFFTFMNLIYPIILGVFFIVLQFCFRTKTLSLHDLRLKQRIDELQQLWELLSQKLSKLEATKLLTTDRAEEFRLEHETNEVSSERQQIGQQWSNLEAQLSSKTHSRSDDHTPSASVTLLRFSILGAVLFEWKTKYAVLVRLLLVSLIILSFTVPAFRDYTRIFPVHLKMNVFFDDEGIEKSLLQFTESELLMLSIDKNWKAGKIRYLQKLSDDIQSKVEVSFHFEKAEGEVTSTGETYFKVVKVRGWQKYRIVEGRGLLHHYFEAPGREKIDFTSEFELIDTDANYIEASLADLYVRFTKILLPEYKQIIRVSPAEPYYHHKVTALIKVRFFPISEVGNTIYLLHDEQSQGLVPIGYAVYTLY